MIILDKRTLKCLKSKDLVELECYTCKKSFYKMAAEVRQVLYNPNNKKNKLKFCSISCAQAGKNNIKYKLARKNGPINIKLQCEWCKKEFDKKISEFKKSRKHFCSKSCNAKYGNKHRLFGKIKRSDFEKWAEAKLKSDYKNIKILFNNRKILNGLEIDIYIPKLKVAFEINGPGHYDPIYGKESLDARKKADRKKRYISNKNGIRFHSIAAKNLSKSNKKEYNKYYKKIQNKIDNYLQGAELDSTGI